jgi:hypothetical protein
MDRAEFVRVTAGLLKAPAAAVRLSAGPFDWPKYLAALQQVADRCVALGKARPELVVEANAVVRCVGVLAAQVELCHVPQDPEDWAVVQRLADLATADEASFAASLISTQEARHA